MDRFLRAVRFVVLMGDYGEFHHFVWVAIATVFVAGAILKNNLPEATLLPILGALLAGLAAGWLVRRIQFRGRGRA